MGFPGHEDIFTPKEVLPEVLTVGVSKVTLLPQPSQDGPALPLQADQSAVL